VHETNLDDPDELAMVAMAREFVIVGSRTRMMMKEESEMRRLGHLSSSFSPCHTMLLTVAQCGSRETGVVISGLGTQPGLATRVIVSDYGRTSGSTATVNGLSPWSAVWALK
jgi:hypothetical protein